MSFVFLAVGFLCEWIFLYYDGFDITYLVIEVFYIFFAFFMTLAAMKHKRFMEEFGFMNTVVVKTIFYIFLGTMALGNFKFWSCWIATGGVLGVSVLNLVRLCGKKEPESAKV